MEDNWDENGSKGYLRKTWARAVRFLVWYAVEIYSKSNVVMRPADISGGPNGSVKLWWKSQDFRLLINVPENVKEEATFYGDDRRESVIKGNFALDELNAGLLMCLANMR